MELYRPPSFSASTGAHCDATRSEATSLLASTKTCIDVTEGEICYSSGNDTTKHFNK